MVTDLDGGRWADLTFFRGSPPALKNLRTELRIYWSE